MRHLYALAEFDDRTLVVRTCELAISAEVKTQNAPFLLRACIANRRHGPRRGRSCASTGTRRTSAFPRNTIVRMVDSVKLLIDRPMVADVQAFFAEHPIEQAAKTLDQMLERQRVNTAVRERNADQLRYRMATDTGG